MAHLFDFENYWNFSNKFFILRSEILVLTYLLSYLTSSGDKNQQLFIGIILKQLLRGWSFTVTFNDTDGPTDAEAQCKRLDA